MEESWQRFRPPQAANICPTCSISHFPFCPRPLPFDHRIPHDPQLSFLDPIANPQHQRIPFPPLPSETRFLTNPNFDRDTLNQFPPIGDSNRRNGLYSPPPHGNRRESIESDRINKRMRVGDMGTGLGSFMPPPPVPPNLGYNASRLSLEDERRLNLIRDHGAPQSNMQFRDQLRGYSNEISHVDRFEESRGSEWKPSPPTSNYYDPVSRFGERAGSILSQERAFDLEHRGYEEKKEAGFGFEQQMAQSNIGGFQSNVDSVYPRNSEGSGNGLFNTQMNEPMQQQSQYGHGSNLAYSHQSYGPSNVPASVPDYVNSSQQGHYSANFVREENQHYMNQGEHPYSNLQKDALNREPHISHNAPTNAPIPPKSRENYYGHDPYYLPTKGNNQAEEFKQHHVSNNSHLYSGSDIPNHVNRQSVNFYEEKSGAGQLFEVKHPPLGHMEVSTVHQNRPGQEQFGSTKTNQPGPYLPMSAGNDMVPNGQVQVPTNQSYGIPPPLPPLPPPPLPMEPPGPPPPYPQARFSPPKQSSSMHTIPVASSTPPPSLHPSAGQSFTPKIPSPDKPKIIDATCLFKQPFRATRPDHMVIILRGLPGSGKSYLAKMLRDLEVESGAAAPRIHSMDDYFMTEVEKVEESSKSSSSGKGKKRTTKKVMEYCYEPEMEEAYRSSMLKAFKKTLEDGMFTFIIVDDRNLRVADFAQFWASAKRSGYEVYLLEASYKDPAGCAARNIHGFTSDDIKKMAETWEEAPSLYLRLDSQSLFSGDVLKEHGIQEVDMDTEDVVCDVGTSVLHNTHSMKKVDSPSDDCAIHGFVKDEGRWDAERDPIGVKELGRSKWLDDVDEDIERLDGKGNVNALSGLIQAYSKGEKSVHWGDQVGKTGFAIGAAKRENSLSLVIGPGAGYNLKSNPLPEDEDLTATTHNGWESKKRNVFQELNRAEHESFRAVFDRRRQRIGGLGVEDE